MKLPVIMGPSSREQLRSVDPTLTVIPDKARLPVVQRLTLDLDFVILQNQAMLLAEQVTQTEKRGQPDRDAARQLALLNKEMKDLEVVKQTGATADEIFAAKAIVQSTSKDAEKTLE